MHSLLNPDIVFVANHYYCMGRARYRPIDDRSIDSVEFKARAIVNRPVPSTTLTVYTSVLGKGFSIKKSSQLI